MYGNAAVFCLYRDDGQEITFRIEGDRIVKQSYPLTDEEIYYVLKQYFKNENSTKNKR